jgi:addiction module HigA family antidote
LVWTLMASPELLYRPSQGVAPGKLLEEFLTAKDISARELARRCGRSAKLIVEIIAGKAPIEPETALQFERVLDMDAELWLGLESHYRLDLAKAKESERMSAESAWAAQFPTKELEKRGVLTAATVGERVRELLAFFGAGSVDACRDRFNDLADVSYRHSPSFNSNVEALLVWLRLGEREADAVSCAEYDKARFLKELRGIRQLTVLSVSEFLPEVQVRCARAGVAFALVKPLKGVALSGVSRWLTPRKALILQSLRHKTNDHFWFTFFHEAAHLLLHSRKSVFLDDKAYGSADPKAEEEANEWAANFLIPQADLLAFIGRFGGTADEVVAFAAQQGIAPGIVVGQLQKRSVLTYAQMHGLKEHYKWDDED